MMLRNGRDLKFAFGLGSNMVFPHQPGNPILTTGKAMRIKFCRYPWTAIDLTSGFMNSSDLLNEE